MKLDCMVLPKQILKKKLFHLKRELEIRQDAFRNVRGYNCHIEFRKGLAPYFKNAIEIVLMQGSGWVVKILCTM